MAIKLVDVFLRDEKIETYTLEWGLLNTPLFEQDFIDRARMRLKDDGYSDDDIALAHFTVRDPEDAED